jgi:hypothetical protein
MNYDLEYIRREVHRLARAVGAPDWSVPTFDWPPDDARPHIQVDRDAFHYIIVERGIETERMTTTSLDDLLYRASCDMTFSVAVNYELAHRVRGQDARRVMFDRQVTLLGGLNPKWAARQAREHDEILARNPFTDGLPQ